MDKVIYGGFTFQDSDLTLIEGGRASLYYSPLGDELRAGEYSIPVKFVPRQWQIPAETFKAFVYGTPVDIYDGETLLHRFYLTDIVAGQRLGEGSYVFNLVGVDFIGLYANVPHDGGVYSNVDAGEVIAETLGALETSRDADKVTYQTDSGITYTVALDTATSRIDGWLPLTKDARTSLRSVLQMVNASPQQNADGTPHFGPMDHGTELTISEYDTYQGDQYESNPAVTGVQVVEYDYQQIGTAEEEQLYEAADTVQNYKVVFDKPYFDLRGDGLTILSFGANFAYVTGLGVLYGKPYAVSQRVLSASTAQTGAENVKTIDNTLCSSLWSYNLLVRMVRWFGHASLVDNAVAMPEQYGPGRLISYMDPMFEEKSGYPVEMQMLYSGITKASQKVTADWTPADEAPFTQSEIVTASGTWTPPEGATRLRFYLIGGGSGGWGGYPGEDGGDHNTTFGPGGAVGEGGDGGKVLQVNVEYDNMAPSYTIAIGAGGAGGAIDHGQGAEGGATTLDDGQTVHSSADGVTHPFGVVDLIGGQTYAADGDNGIYAGGDGTGYAHPAQSVTDTETTQTGTTTTWTGGTDYPSTGPVGNQGGGGAAYGNNGGDAVPEHRGGNGADAALDGFNGYTAGQPSSRGQGGLGGNGGGGGGCGGNGAQPALGDGVGGAGGHGSIGGQGADGAVLVLIAFGTAPQPVQDYFLYDSDGEQLYDANYEALKEAH